MIALTETWLDDSVNDSELIINNYCLIRAYRNLQRGGVCLFIGENFTFNRKLDILTDSIETLWVAYLSTVPQSCGKSRIVGFFPHSRIFATTSRISGVISKKQKSLKIAII